MLKLNLGCGTDIKKRWVNVDKYPVNKQVKKVVMEKRFPFPNDYFDEVLAKHCLEHSKDREFTIKELYRVCKNGARVTVVVPHVSFPRAMTDTGHYSVWDSVTFNKFDKRHKRNYCKNINFRVVNVSFVRLVFANFLLDFANKHKEFWEVKVASVFPVQTVKFVLEVVK